MTPDGIKVILDEPTAMSIKAMAKNKIVDKIVEAYLESEEGKALIKSVRVDSRRLEVAVEHALVQEIIKDWAARHGE